MFKTPNKVSIYKIKNIMRFGNLLSKNNKQKREINTEFIYLLISNVQSCQNQLFL